ncbi:PKD domain-containing protein [Fulvivirga sp.]|uniref:PKD domain-containing protein n=2 Tax=Fulvivirga sp. TaxID=1931237 RepID=UPI0032EF37EA
MDIEVADLGVYYKWDFCEGDLSDTPVISLKNTYSEIKDTRSLDIVYDSTNWYGFALDRTTNSLLRINFGTSLDTASPTIADLGDLDEELEIPESIKIIYEDGSWYGIVHNSGTTNELLRLNFGSSLTNTPAVSVILSSVGDDRTNIDFGNSNDSLIVVLSNFGASNFTVINLGSSINNTPTGADHFNFTGVSSAPSIALFNQCDNWYGVTNSAFNLKAYLLDFGTSLFSTPTISEIGTNLFSVSPRKIKIEKDNDEYIILAISNNGRLHRINLGSDLTSITPSYTDLGINGGMNRTESLDLVKEQSTWYSFSFDRQFGRLYQIKFPNNCNAIVSTSTSQEPKSIYYTSSGIYNTGLKVYDDKGNLIDAISKSITVSTSIAPDIDFVSENVCVMSNITYTGINNSFGTNPITSWSWDFGDGMSDAGVEVMHNYASAGMYEVKLTVGSSNGCNQIFYDNITIYDEPVPDFIVPEGNICTNQPYIFENTTPGDYGDLIDYSWELDGNPISSDQDLDITFSAGGSKELKLIASIPGCEVEIAKNLTNIKEGTLPQFSFDDSCVGDEVLFTNSTSGDITGVNWEFSNGFTSTLSSPTMVFDTEGTYDATLYITNSDGCETFDTRTITIHALPVIDFSNELACEALSTQFEDLSTVNIDNLSSWRWDFGDGSDASEDQNASHIFNSNGDFEVELTATSSFGCVDSLTKTVTVLKAPEVAFDFDKICKDVPIQFTDASVAVEGEEITDWSWNLGGTFSAQQNPQTTFENPLDYSVSLTVTSSNLCTATQTQLISIPETPTLDFSLADDCENETAQITDITDITGDNISNRSWSINASPVSSEPNFAYDFAQAGNYNVTLSVSTENGCEYETSRPVTIHPAPIANFVTSFDFGAPPFVVDFTNQSSGAQSYSWEFEEGATSEEVNPSHTFNSLGEFDISLVAISDQNCPDTASRRIQVLEPLLDAEVINFNILPTATGDKLSFAIRNNGTIRLDSLYVTVNLGGELEIYETINKAMNPNEVISAQLDLTIDNKRLDYICIDVTPFISNYQDVDEDNNRSCITFGQETFIISNPYPNPSTSLVAFDIIATKDAIADIELLSADGDLINTFSAQVYQGNNRLDFDLNQLKSGLYFLKVKLDGQNKVHRLVIIN